MISVVVHHFRCWCVDGIRGGIGLTCCCCFHMYRLAEVEVELGQSRRYWHSVAIVSGASGGVSLSS